MNSRAERQQELYLRVIRERLGLEPDALENGSVRVGVNDLVVVAANTATVDPAILRVVVAFTRPEGLSATGLATVANAVSGACSLAKVLVGDDDVLVVVETLTSPPNTLPSEDTLTVVLTRSLVAALTATRRLQEEIVLVSILEAG